MAKRVAFAYRAFCKAKSIFANPFNPNVPIELQGVFTHFLKAARIIMEVPGTDPKQWVLAQFEGLAFSKHPPYPTQLYSENARLRYTRFAFSTAVRQERIVTEEDSVGSDFGSEERKVRRISQRLGVSERRVLRDMPREFTKAFLQHRGVWHLVAQRFED